MPSTFFSFFIHHHYLLEMLYGGEKIELQLKEAIWIQKLATVRPDGCNVKNSFRTLSTVLESQNGAKPCHDAKSHQSAE